MKVSWKHAFAVGGFLAALCGVLGLAIAGGNLLTKDTIAANKNRREESGLKKVYGDAASYGEAIQIKENEFPTLTKYWTVKVNEEVVGRVYATSDTNAYGTVSLLVGINANFSLGNIITLENTESYATTLQEGYLDVIDQAEDKLAAVAEVKCGATFGAKMCRDMILIAQAHYKGGEK